MINIFTCEKKGKKNKKSVLLPKTLQAEHRIKSCASANNDSAA